LVDVERVLDRLTHALVLRGTVVDAGRHMRLFVEVVRLEHELDGADRWRRRQEQLRWFAIGFARCGGMFTATSLSPFCSGATRTASSGIGRNTTVLILGAPRHQASLASSTTSSSFDQRTNL